MTCLVENKENNHNVEQLASRLSLRYDQTQNKEIVDSSLVESYKHLAYYLLANNNGYGPEFDRNGKDSKIFTELKRMYGGDDVKAIIAKAYIYTPQFIEKYGDWTQSSATEPEFRTVQDPQFTQDVEDLFPNAGLDSTEAVDLMLQDLLHSQVFGDTEINGYNPAINENSIYNTIQEDCKGWVDAKLAEEGVSPKNAKSRSRELKRQYYNEKIDFLFNRITNRFLKEWGLEKDANGLVKMPDWLNKDDYKNKNELTIYDVYEFRCNFLNTLNSRRGDVSQIPVLIQLFKDFLRGSDIDIITENMLSTYIDLYKDSDLFIKILNASGYLTDDSYDKDGKPKKDAVDRGVDAIKKGLVNSLYDINKKANANNGFSKKLSQFWKFIKYVTRLLFSLCKKTNDNIVGSFFVGSTIAVGGIALSLAFAPEYLLVSIGGGILLPYVFKKINEGIEQRWHIESDTAVAYHSSIRDWIMAFALNKALGTHDSSGAFEPGEGTISNIMFDIRHDQTEVMLYRILQNIATQIKSANSRIGQQYTTSAQLAELEELRGLCEEAIRQKNVISSFNTREELDKQQVNKKYHVNQFVERYVQIAESKLSSSYEYLEQVKQLLDENDIGSVDIQQLMRIKTDVIGAYSTMLPVYILSKSKNFGLLDSRSQHIKNDLNEVRTLFSEVLNKYVLLYTDNFLRETAYKSLNKDLYKTRLKDNMEHWFNVQLNNGNLSVFDRNIFAPRTSQSPVVRMVHQKLAEIETNCLAEAGEVGSLLEDIRVANRDFWSKRRFFTNPMNAYAERTKDGKFTGNFISDTNLGQYENDYQEIKEVLKKKHGINTLPDGDYLWENGEDYEYDIAYTIIDSSGISHKTTQHVKHNSDFDRWQAYNTDLILWQAGAEQDADGNFILKDGVQPRIHRRYKYQYYLDKTRILGRDGISVLSDINRQIAELYAECEQTISYKKDGKDLVRKVPILSKLSEYKRLRLQSLINKKSQLANQYWFKMDSDYKNIVSIEKKDEVATKQARKFFLWEQQKHKYYKKEASPNHALWDATKQYLQDNGATQEELDLFEKTTTKLVPSHVLMDLLSSQNEVEYDITDEATREYLDLLKLKRQIRRQILSTNKNRTPDLMRLGDWSNPQKVKNLWVALTKIDQTLHDLRNGTNGKTKIKAKVISLGKEGLDRNDYIDSELVPMLDNNGEEIANYKFKDYLIDWLIRNNISVGQYGNSFKYDSSHDLAWTTFLKYERINDTNALGLYYPDGTKLFPSSLDLYEQIPIGIFSDSQSDMDDSEFDNNSNEYLQINKNNSAYDNREAYNKVKNDKVYQNLLKIMDKAWENYKGFTRKSRYQMPQRLSSKSSVYGRAFLQGGKTGFKTFKSALEYTFHDLYRFDNRDVEINNEVMTRADGTKVETIPSRWIRKLDDPNMIDTDLISSVVDFYNESLRFKYRSQLEPVMEAMYFKLTGGYERSSDAGSNAQAEVVRGEMSRALYGRDVTGFGENGRITQEDALLAKWSKGFRSLLHKRLMSHNWLSVLKNAYDSFCNLLTAAYTGKYILTQNFLNAIGKLCFDWKNKNFTMATQLFGMNRSRATNMTQALMQLNGVSSSVSERFRGQNKLYLRRMLSKSSTLEFEFVDYTSKSIITESVYDSYRLMWNPATNKYEFLNENQAEYAYENRKAGYTAWNDAKNYTLRSCYYQDKATGVAKMKDTVTIKDKNGKIQVLNVIDLIRPKSQISITEDGRSHALENQIRTTIKQMCQTINGMLDSEDKNELAKNYAGALLVSFRGWMISQSSEFYKEGTDFYNWENEGDVGSSKQTIKEILAQKLQLVDKRSSGLEDFDYQGQFNFATGTIDKGLHVALTKNMQANWLDYLSMVTIIPEFIGDSKSRHLKHMSQAQFYQLRNFAAATDFFILTLALTAMAFSFYNGGDGDGDDPILQAKSLTFTTFLASISERFPQLGMLPFLLGSTDLIKAVTVGVTIFDDAHYLLDSAMNFGQYAKNVLSELGVTHEFDEQLEDKDGISKFVDVLSNGSFKGETKAKRDFIKALALFDIDTLPVLLALDALTNNDAVSEKMRKTKYRDYHLNYRKSTTLNAQAGLRKFYETIIPASLFSDWFGWSEAKKKPNTNVVNSQPVSAAAE